jgi:hypothetical protein
MATRRRSCRLPPRVRAVRALRVARTRDRPGPRQDPLRPPPVVLRRDVPDARSGKSQQIQINKLWHWFLSKRRTALLVHQRLAQLWQKRHQRIVIMKTRLLIVIFGALVLMANGANAQHRNHSHGRARGETLQYQSSGDVYESFSEGHQPYANPDRELYVNRTCCNWKSPHRPITN